MNFKQIWNPTVTNSNGSVVTKLCVIRRWFRTNQDVQVWRKSILTNLTFVIFKLTQFIIVSIEGNFKLVTYFYFIYQVINVNVPIADDYRPVITSAVQILLLQQSYFITRDGWADYNQIKWRENATKLTVGLSLTSYTFISVRKY